MFYELFSKLKHLRSFQDAGVARYLQARANIGSNSRSSRRSEAAFEDEQLSKSGPCICVEIIDGRRDLGTPFNLYNRGHDQAYDIQILPIHLKTGTATFRKVRSLSRGESKELLPIVETSANLHKHDMTGLLMVEWKSYHDSTLRQLPVNGSLSYRDSKRNWFETSFELTFFPFKDAAPSEWGGRPKMVEATGHDCHLLSRPGYTGIFRHKYGLWTS